MEKEFSSHDQSKNPKTYVDSFLKNEIYEKERHESNKGSLVQWKTSGNEIKLVYRFEIIWSDEALPLLVDNLVEIEETRSFHFIGDSIKVESTIKTQWKYLNATVFHEISPENNGSIDSVKIKLIYKGKLFYNQILEDFFTGLSPHIHPLGENKVNQNQEEEIFQKTYSFVQGLMNVSKKFVQHISEQKKHLSSDQATREDSPTLLPLPNRDQIRIIPLSMDLGRFSMKSEIARIRLQIDDSTKLVAEIKHSHPKSPPTSINAGYISLIFAGIYFVLLATK